MRFVDVTWGYGEGMGERIAKMMSRAHGTKED